VTAGDTPAVQDRATPMLFFPKFAADPVSRWVKPLIHN
jgi:hypothetical protein